LRVSEFCSCTAKRPRSIERQFGHVKTGYRVLARNRARIITLFALGNLFEVRWLMA